MIDLVEATAYPAELELSAVHTRPYATLAVRQTQGSEVIPERDAELSDVVEVVVRMLAVGDEGANGQSLAGMNMCTDPEHGLGVGDLSAGANDIRAGMGA